MNEENGINILTVSIENSGQEIILKHGQSVVMKISIPRDGVFDPFDIERELVETITKYVYDHYDDDLYKDT